MRMKDKGDTILVDAELSLNQRVALWGMVVFRKLVAKKINPHFALVFMIIQWLKSVWLLLIIG
jgi:hypothetical protein